MNATQPVAVSYPSHRRAVAIAQERSRTDGDRWIVVPVLRHRGWHMATSERAFASMPGPRESFYGPTTDTFERGVRL